MKLNTLLAAAAVAVSISGCSQPNNTGNEVNDVTTEVEAKTEQALNTESTPAAAEDSAESADNVARFADGITIGSADAEWAVIEFSDYQCRFCAKFHEETFPTIKSELIDSNQLLYVVREYPLHTIHPLAPLAAVVARCAVEQDKFMEVRDALYANYDSMTAENLLEITAVDGFSEEQLRTCAERGDVQTSITNSAIYAGAMGLTSTPTFLIGKNVGNGIVNVVKMSGAKDYETFLQALDAAKNASSE